MTYDSRYGEFFYSEDDMRQDLKEHYGYTDEEIDNDFKVLNIEEIGDDFDYQYKVEGSDEVMNWEELKAKYNGLMAICNATDGGPEIVQIVVSKQ